MTRKYARISDESRQELINLVSSGIQIKKAANQLGIGYESAKVIHRTYKNEQRTSKRKSRLRFKKNDDRKELIINRKLMEQKGKANIDRESNKHLICGFKTIQKPEINEENATMINNLWKSSHGTMSKIRKQQLQNIAQLKLQQNSSLMKLQLRQQNQEAVEHPQDESTIQIPPSVINTEQTIVLSAECMLGNNDQGTFSNNPHNIKKESCQNLLHKSNCQKEKNNQGNTTLKKNQIIQQSPEEENKDEEFSSNESSSMSSIIDRILIPQPSRPINFLNSQVQIDINQNFGVEQQQTGIQSPKINCTSNLLQQQSNICYKTPEIIKSSTNDFLQTSHFDISIDKSSQHELQAQENDKSHSQLQQLDLVQQRSSEPLENHQLISPEHSITNVNNNNVCLQFNSEQKQQSQLQQNAFVWSKQPPFQKFPSDHSSDSSICDILGIQM